MTTTLDWNIRSHRVAIADVFTWKGGRLVSVHVSWWERGTWTIEVTTRGCCHDMIDIDCDIPCPALDEPFPVAVLEKTEEKLREVGLIKTAPAPAVSDPVELHLDWTAEDSYRRAVIVSAKGRDVLTAHLRYSEARSGWCASVGAPGVSLFGELVSSEPDAIEPPVSVRVAAEAWIRELGLLPRWGAVQPAPSPSP